LKSVANLAEFDCQIRKQGWTTDCCQESIDSFPRI